MPARIGINPFPTLRKDRGIKQLTYKKSMINKMFFMSLKENSKKAVLGIRSTNQKKNYKDKVYFFHIQDFYTTLSPGL